MKIIVTTPLFITNEIHLEYTEKTIRSVLASQTEHEVEIALVVNKCLPEYREAINKLSPVVLENTPNCVAAAWNKGILYGLEQQADYVLVINNDILFHPRLIDNLVKFAQEHPDGIIWTGGEYPDDRSIKTAEVKDFSFDEHPHFSCFLINADGIARLRVQEELTKEPIPGLFDPGIIPAYGEDNDYHQRILHAGLKAYKTASALFYHYGSRTIKCDDELNKMNFVTYNRNRVYFLLKWGFEYHGKAVSNDDPIRKRFAAPWGEDISKEVKEKMIVSPIIMDEILEILPK